MDTNRRLDAAIRFLLRMSTFAWRSDFFVDLDERSGWIWAERAIEAIDDWAVLPSSALAQPLPALHEPPPLGVEFGPGSDDAADDPALPSEAEVVMGAATVGHEVSNGAAAALAKEATVEGEGGVPSCRSSRTKGTASKRSRQRRAKGRGRTASVRNGGCGE